MSRCGLRVVLMIARLPRANSEVTFRVLADPDLDRSQSGCEPLRLMAVHAHPDDESSKGAATMARYVREGVEVLVCTCTGGERGSVLNPKMDRREILGVQQRFMGFVDSGLPENEDEQLPEGCFALQKLEDAAAPLVAAVREF